MPNWEVFTLGSLCKLAIIAVLGPDVKQGEARKSAVESLARDKETLLLDFNIGFPMLRGH